MSRLAIHKPLSFTFPSSHPSPSPPETLLTDNGYSVTTATPPTNNEHHDRNEEHVPFAHEPVSLHSRPGRSSISYQNSGLREPFSRPPVHRSYRFFVVVVPPLRLVDEHGRLGHTLASGPPHRLEQGIIMPLFPTMYGQLTAIAKEFNFPSTTGLCLYLHVNENGVTMTPRISDESWHMLWNHLFDVPSASRGPPIGGKIEFDVDFQQARWYSSWLSTMVRSYDERPVLHIPTGAPSMHVPHEAQNSVAGEFFRDYDHPDNSQPPPQRSIPVPSRDAPKKLSLVDGLDFPTMGSRLENRTGLTSALAPSNQVFPTKSLLPITQEEESQSIRDQLDSRVESWRVNANVKPVTGLDGVAPPSASGELNVNDFTWSISSAGPDDYDIMSLGPPSERVHSPDIAHRMLDDSPPTPSTATSWGPPSSYPPSPVSDYRPPSLDLAFRSILSPPMSPATATSWGPPSPTSSFHWDQDIPQARSIHLGDRGEFSRPVSPSTVTTWGAPLSYPPTPTIPFYIETPDLAKRFFDFSQEHETAKPRSSLSLPSSRPWHSVWPYFQARKTEHTSIGSVEQASGYPFFSIYPPVYPHFELYPTVAVAPSAEQEHEKALKAPPDNSYSSLPNAMRRPQETLSVSLAASFQYPAFDLYPAVYPHFNLYPAIQRPSSDLASNRETVKKSLIACSKNAPSYGVYPQLVIYPAVYPYFNIYPPRAAEAKADSIPKDPRVRLSIQYPNFNIYPAVHPNSLINPISPAKKVKEAAGVSPTIVFGSHYPFFDLYPAPAKNVKETVHYPLFDLYPAPAKNVKETVHYPFFDLYPAQICPLKAGDGVGTATSNTQKMNIVQPDAYPIIRPYPPVYPFFDLYPSKPSVKITSKSTESDALPPQTLVTLAPEIDSVVYPCFSLYPPIVGKDNEIRSKAAQTSSVFHYPYLQIYSPVYPHLSIYPPIAASSESPPQIEVHITDDNVPSAAKRHTKPSRKSHQELHQEVFHRGPVRTPSGTGMTIHPEVDLRPLDVPSRHNQRRIITTRSPTGPAIHIPITPPALPSPSRRLPTPPKTNGTPRSPNVMEQIAGFNAEISAARRYSSAAGVTAARRASLISPLRHVPLPRPVESWVHPDETLTAVPPSGPNRTRSTDNTGRTVTIKSRIRDSSIVQRQRDIA